MHGPRLLRNRPCIVQHHGLVIIITEREIMPISRNHLTGVSLFCLVAAHSTAALAQASYDFSLPRQPLAETLRAIGRQTATSILFAPEVVEHLTASAIKGRLSVNRTGFPLSAIL